MLAKLDAEDDNLEYDRICQSAAAGTLPFRFKTLVLAGFNLFSPRQRGLIESVGKQGIRVVQLRAQTLEPNRVEHIVAADPEAQWRMAEIGRASCRERVCPYV